MYHPVFDGIKARSWQGADEDLEALRVDAYTLEESLQTTYDFDAFTTGYVVATPTGEYLQALPRLSSSKSKDALRRIREDGGDVLMRAIFIDLDRQPHEPWKDFEEARRWVEDLAGMLPEAVVYATKRGMRVVFKLRRLVATEHFYKIARAAMRYVETAVKRISAPVTFDESCLEWDRLARLPYVTRDGQSSADTTFLRMPDVWVGWFPGHSALAEIEQEIERLAESVQAQDQPRGIPDMSEAAETQAEAVALLAPPALRRTMALVLKGEKFYERGERNSKTWKLIASLYTFVAARSDLPTPTDVYALLYRSISASSGTDAAAALAETWGMCQRLYARAKAKQEVEDRERVTALEAARDKNPVVVYMNKGRWVWDPERRTYGQATTDGQTLLAEVARLHPLVAMGDSGKIVPVHAILREAGVRAYGIRNMLGQRGSRLVRENDGRTFLEVGVAEIVDVPAKFHPECQEYLDLICKHAGEEDGRRFLEWIATCTNLAHPTTALVLRGASGAGKDMIAESLARLFGGKAAFAKSMDRFNSMLLESALIHLNEGMDDKAKSGPVANRFREIIGGGTLDIELKGVDPTTIRGNYRSIITANNPQPLPVQNTKTLEDFRAIANRVLHVWMDDAVRNWLEAQGGREGFTFDWVDRDLGDRSEPGKLVEHFAWLIANYPARKFNSRFLVPANVGSWHARSLLQGILRDIISAAGFAATSEGAMRAVRIHAGKVYVTDDEALQSLVNKINHTQHDVREIKTAVREALIDGLPVRLPLGGATKIYYPLPMDLLLAIMEPENPEIFLEEAEIYQRLTKMLDDSTKVS